MTDRETLAEVAKGYNDLIALEKKRRDLMAQMIRACLVQLRSTNSAKRKEGFDALGTLADMLEGKDT